MPAHRPPSPLEQPRSTRQHIRDWFHERRDLWIHSVRDVPMIVLFTMAVTGILLAESYSPTPLVCLYATLASSLPAILFALARAYRTAIAFSLLATASLFATLHATHLHHASVFASLPMAKTNWSPIVLEGIIDAVPRWRPDILQYEQFKNGNSENTPAWHTLYEIRMTAVRDRREWIPATGRLILTVEAPRRDLFPGDSVRIYAKWQRIPVPTNPGQFDLAKFYARKDIHLRARSENGEQIQRLTTPEPYRLDRWLGILLERGDRAMHRYVPFGQSKLASALVLGQRDQVEWELQESLLATGTMHMLAISGLHVEMVAISIVTIALFFRLPRKGILLCTALLVIAYGILCGAQPPVLRAVVLVVSLCIARWLARATHSLNLLALAGLILLALRTSHLFDIGTQLSFLAVAMLSLLAMHAETSTKALDPLKELLYETSPWWKRSLIDAFHFARQSLLTSLWVWLVTAPLILSTFHVISPIAILLNLILWFPLLVALLSGLGILILGTWLPPAGFLFGAICGICLAFTAWVIDLAEQIPGSHFWMPAPSIEWTLVFYAMLLGLWSILGFKKNRRAATLIGLAIWTLLGLLPIQRWTQLTTRTLEPPNAALNLIVMDVGHGSAILISTPRGQHWMYDAGRMGDQDRSFVPIASVLWHQHLMRLDGFILSHADADHYNAMAGIAKRFRPKTLWTTEQVLTHSSPNLRRILDGLQQQGTDLCVWGQGGRWSDGELSITALHPPPQGVAGNDNANSLVLAVEFGGRKILLTGDLEGTGTQSLLQDTPQHFDIVLAPHHGSLSKDPRPLLEWSSPSWVIISGGPRATSHKVQNTYTTSDPQNASPRLPGTTHRDGAIRVEITPNGTWKAWHWNRSDWESIMIEDLPATSSRSADPSLRR